MSHYPGGLQGDRNWFICSSLPMLYHDSLVEELDTFPSVPLGPAHPVLLWPTCPLHLINMTALQDKHLCSFSARIGVEAHRG